jgi:hypothetical protein
MLAVYESFKWWSMMVFLVSVLMTSLWSFSLVQVSLDNTKLWVFYFSKVRIDVFF